MNVTMKACPACGGVGFRIYQDGIVWRVNCIDCNWAGMRNALVNLEVPR